MLFNNIMNIRIDLFIGVKTGHFGAPCTHVDKRQ